MIGHFIQPDTLIPQAGASASYDRYAYVNGNPVNFNDPSGHFAPLVGAAVGAIVGFSVDILIQTAPQILNGVSPLDVDINWFEAGGATVAGLVSGATLGVGTLVAAGTSTGVSITTMAFAGGVGNVLGNQAGALTSGVLESGFTQKGAMIAQKEYGFGNKDKMAVDFVVGGIASGFTESVTQISTLRKVPKVIKPEYSLTTNGGTAYRYVPKPDLNILGNPNNRLNFNNVIKPVTIYTGLTTLSNYTENAFSSIVAEAVLRKKVWSTK